MSVHYSSRRYAFDKPVKFEGRLLLEFTPADVGSISRASWVLNPIQFGTTKVLDDLAHQFVWFRFKKLRVVTFSSSSTIGECSAVCLLTYPAITIPADMESIVETEFSAVCYTGQTVPSEMDLGPKELGQGQPKWFRVEPTGDDYLEFQGLLVWGDSNQGLTAKKLVCEYEIEFLGLADDPLTPAPLAKRPGMAHEPMLLKVEPRPAHVHRRRIRPQVMVVDCKEQGHQQPRATDKDTDDGQSFTFVPTPGVRLEGGTPAPSPRQVVGPSRASTQAGPFLPPAVRR